MNINKAKWLRLFQYPRSPLRQVDMVVSWFGGVFHLSQHPLELQAVQPTGLEDSDPSRQESIFDAYGGLQILLSSSAEYGLPTSKLGPS